MTDYSEFDQLLSQYLEGSVSDAELGELEAKLLSDDEFAEHVSRWCIMHRQVSELMSEGAFHKLMDQFVKASPALPRHFFAQAEAQANEASAEDESLTEPSRRGSKSVWRRARPMSAFLAIGASAALLILAAMLWQSGRPTGNAVADRAAPAVAEPAAAEVKLDGDKIATLTKVVDAVWETDAPALRHGQQLGKGSRVALRSGLVKVTFDCGAEVVLQGPCDFVVQSQMAGKLNSGRITADVPRRAFTFAIISPDVDFVDLGTSFGVSVGGDGQTELHVFEGEVLCSQSKKANADRNDIIHVTADKAVEFAHPHLGPSDIEMDRQQFSLLIAMRRTPQLEPAQLARDHLALWLAADMAVVTDESQRVILWPDILCGDNRSAEDAIQYDSTCRPTLVPDAVHGHPGIHFDGKADYLVTTPLETTDDQTVMFVCQFSPNAYDKDRVWGGQIINYDGPPSRYLSNTLEPGVLQIGEPLLASEFKPTLLTGQVFAGFVGSATVEAGRIDAEQVGADVPVVVAYRYDYSGGKSELFINGRSYGQARAFAPQGITSRKIIGRHAWMQLFYHGDLAEMLIYNKALSPGELADTTAYLASKYAIDVVAVKTQAEAAEGVK